MNQSLRHPAKYSDSLLPFFRDLLEGYDRVLDPFAGTGKLRCVRPDAFLLEIEPEWAAIGGAEVGNAMQMKWEDDFFDAICTSPCYGNRMADSFTDHQVEKNYKRNTYTHCLGRKLDYWNAGQMQWGEVYRVTHFIVWKECRRVLRPGGRFVLNISDHIRNKQVVPVSDWHKRTLIALGFEYHDELSYQVPTPRQRQGANGNLRVEYENIFVFTNRKEQSCLP